MIRAKRSFARKDNPPTKPFCLDGIRNEFYLKQWIKISVHIQIEKRRQSLQSTPKKQSLLSLYSTMLLTISSKRVIQMNCLLLLVQFIKMINSKEQMVRCPYDPKHVMPHDRFICHLDKCKSPNKTFFRACRYNSYHVIRKEELEGHENTCTDGQKYQTSPKEDEWEIDMVEQPKKISKSVISYNGSKASVITYNTVTPKQNYEIESNSPKKPVKFHCQDFDQLDFSGKDK